ncbi:hypothetical protein ES703_03899 [subsurface metagenome]
MAAIEEFPVGGKPVGNESTAALYCGIKLAAYDRDQNAELKAVYSQPMIDIAVAIRYEHPVYFNAILM